MIAQSDGPHAKFQTGDRVQLVRVPEWLLEGLPQAEQRRISSYVGLVTTVTDVDQYGYYWIGFGETADAEEGFSACCGHSFCVTGDCLKKTAG